MTEQQLQTKILKYLKSIDAWSVKTISTNARGTPDILGVYKGTMFAIEVKRPGQLHNVSPIQQHQLNSINDRGGLAFAADSLQTVISKMSF